MGISCGKVKFSSNALNDLRFLGGEIDAERQLSVFDGGLVGPIDGQKSKVSDAAQSYPRDRSATRPRKRSKSRAWSRSTGQAKPFRSDAHEAAFGDQFRTLALHYQALAFEDRNGLWVAVKTRPLGLGGPPAFLLIGVPFDKAITPRGWAFNWIGEAATLFPLKHTNFPDASICAFTKESGAWEHIDGLTALVDHFSLWVVKSWHRTHLNWWPGPQIGVTAYYRIREFQPNEWCGCNSGRQYRDCHEIPDRVVPRRVAEIEFVQRFGSRYEDRRAPAGVLKAAKTRWRILPDMALLFGCRQSVGEPQIPLL